MRSPGTNEGFRILDEFACDANAEPSSVAPDYKGRGVNPGMDVVTELLSSASQQPVSRERVAELRALSTLELLALVRLQTSELSSQELLVIHSIAAERLEGQGSVFESAIELSQEVMVVAVNKSA